MNKENHNIKNARDNYSNNDLNPDLLKLKEDNPFVVPADYFENLTDIIR